MRCPHCAKHIHVRWAVHVMAQGDTPLVWYCRALQCPECSQPTIEIAQGETTPVDGWQRVHPIGATRDPAPPVVPVSIAKDFVEAARVLGISAKASAALSRRCLQAILQDQGYRGRDLAPQIDALLAEADPARRLPASLRDTVDAIRNFGNFSAHPITDVTQFQVIDVEPEEAEWCLEIIEELFQHYYARPAQGAARRAALNAKLASANKPPAK